MFYQIHYYMLLFPLADSLINWHLYEEFCTECSQYAESNQACDTLYVSVRNLQ